MVLRSPKLAGLTLTELNPDHAAAAAGSVDQLTADLARLLSRSSLQRADEPHPGLTSTSSAHAERQMRPGALRPARAPTSSRYPHPTSRAHLSDFRLGTLAQLPGSASSRTRSARPGLWPTSIASSASSGSARTRCRRVSALATYKATSIHTSGSPSPGRTPCSVSRARTALEVTTSCGRTSFFCAQRAIRVAARRPRGARVGRGRSACDRPRTTSRAGADVAAARSTSVARRGIGVGIKEPRGLMRPAWLLSSREGRRPVGCRFQLLDLGDVDLRPRAARSARNVLFSRRRATVTCSGSTDGDCCVPIGMPSDSLSPA